MLTNVVQNGNGAVPFKEFVCLIEAASWQGDTPRMELGA
jgi:hypothetical protein